MEPADPVTPPEGVEAAGLEAPAPVPRRRPAAVWAEILLVFAPVVLAGSLLSSLRNSRLEVSLVGSLSVILSLLVATAFLRREGRGWRDYGLARGPGWKRTLGIAVLLLVGTMVVVGVLQLTMRVVGAPPPDYSRFAALRGNPQLLVLTLVVAWGSAAFGEEMLVRGFLMNRLAETWGRSPAAWASALISSSVFFGAAHFYQGPSGMLLTGMIGLIFGGVYLAAGRNLWVTILAHGAIDTISLVALYAGAA